MDPRAKKILDYWFGDSPLTPESLKERNKLWFGGEESTDREIREKFGEDVAAAVEGRNSDWERSPLECLALVVLLDQFSLNIHRNQARAFEQSAMAIPIVERAISRRFDCEVSPIQRVFYYLPLEHAESLPLQERSVALFRKLAEEAPETAGYLDYAIRHWEVVKRFGRFPDRNELFGRTPTPEEAKYMAQGGPPF